MQNSARGNGSDSKERSLPSPFLRLAATNLLHVPNSGVTIHTPAPPAPHPGGCPPEATWGPEGKWLPSTLSPGLLGEHSRSTGFPKLHLARPVLDQRRQRDDSQPRMARTICRHPRLIQIWLNQCMLQLRTPTCGSRGLFGRVVGPHF